MYKYKTIYEQRSKFFLIHNIILKRLLFAGIHKKEQTIIIMFKLKEKKN